MGAVRKVRDLVLVLKLIKRSREMLNIFKSKTSATIAGGTIAGGVSAHSILALLRSLWPDMPGDAATDGKVAAFIMAFLVPIITRWVASRRGKT